MYAYICIHIYIYIYIYIYVYIMLASPCEAHVCARARPRGGEVIYLDGRSGHDLLANFREGTIICASTYEYIYIYYVGML